MGKFSFQMNVQFTVAPYLGEEDVGNSHAHTVIRLCGHHGSGKGVVAQPQPVH